MTTSNETQTGGNARSPSEWIIVAKKVDMSDFICTKSRKYFPQGQCVASGCRDDKFNLYLPLIAVLVQCSTLPVGTSDSRQPTKLETGGNAK